MEAKTKTIESYKLHAKDTGSADVQVALLTQRINHLTEHLQTNKKDHSSRRGLLVMVGQRRRLLDYLQSTDLTRYQTLTKKLKLRKYAPPEFCQHLWWDPRQWRSPIISGPWMVRVNHPGPSTTNKASSRNPSPPPTGNFIEFRTGTVLPGGFH